MPRASSKRQLTPEEKGEIQTLYDEGMALRKQHNELMTKRQQWEEERTKIGVEMDVKRLTREQFTVREDELNKLNRLCRKDDEDIAHINTRLEQLIAQIRDKEADALHKEKLLVAWSSGGMARREKEAQIEETRRYAKLETANADAFLMANPDLHGADYPTMQQDARWQEATHKIYIAKVQLESADKQEAEMRALPGELEKRLRELRGTLS
jgi:hypothetical protein